MYDYTIADSLSAAEHRLFRPPTRRHLAAIIKSVVPDGPNWTQDRWYLHNRDLRMSIRISLMRTIISCRRDRCHAIARSLFLVLTTKYPHLGWHHKGNFITVVLAGKRFVILVE